MVEPVQGIKDGSHRAEDHEINSQGRVSGNDLSSRGKLTYTENVFAGNNDSQQTAQANRT